jgi:uncharacterized protein YbbC (DUF1343 family)/beta-glucosidase-like glycosyl hydrolase
MFAWLAWWLLATLPTLPALCSSVLTPAPVAGEPPPLGASERAWVKATLKRLDLRAKVAQLLFVRAYGRPQNPESPEYRELLREVTERKVGGLVLFRSELDTVPVLLNALQEAADVPLLVAADLEHGLSFRVEAGPVPLPDAMAIGALGGMRAEEAARFAGELTGREGRAAGIHWALAPVADVNNNPDNPVINIRSFGEDPQRVSRLVSAFIEGARRGGILTSVKHFPGHGDTATDSHLGLPVIGGDRARLDRVELAPFRAAIEAGVDGVMLGHLAVPAIDPSGRPATLSPILSTQLLREEFDFHGLVVTDAMEMQGVGSVWAGRALIEAFRAGADVLLLPPDSRVAMQALVRAVEEGEIEVARLDASVERVLTMKARLGLQRKRAVDPAAMRRAVGRPQDLERARRIAQESITLVRNQGGVVPLAAERPLRLLHLVLASDWIHNSIGGIPEAELAARGILSETRRLGPDLSETTRRQVLAAAPQFTHVLVSAFVRVTSSKGTADMDPTHAALLDALAGVGPPVIVVSYGNPYLLRQFPRVQAYLCAFSAVSTSQRAAIAAIFGEAPIDGRMPVSLPGISPHGAGIELPRRAMSLRIEEAPAGTFAEVDRRLEEFRAGGAFPGAVLAVGHRGRLVHLSATGRLSYEADSPAVTPATIYDLASLTKVLATTTMAMILVDEGRIDLDAKVQTFLPAFRGRGKEKVTLRHLLTHSAGIDWWAPLYKEIKGQRAFLERIQAMDLVTEPGARSKYSDLGLILLGEILERAAGQSLEEFTRERVFGPLGMKDTLYRPGPDRLARIAPTERDDWRGRVVRGEVHDENAFALGGVAAHAGLFGTAPDLARFAQMLLDGGAFEHRRIVARETVTRFTQRSTIVDSSRALGWDTKSPEGSSAGTLLSASSFGHTGFTGTSLWIDPERELFVILLSNRVHPTRENNRIREVRPAIADAVVRALGLTVSVGNAGNETPVRTGLDRIESGELELLRGKRVGLVAHAASVTASGWHALPVLRSRGVEVVRLFSPEHGFTGTAAAGARVADALEPASGLPIVSLHGERSRPSPQDLAGLDALVVDLQDAGVRFYTYASTLIECLEAAADADLELVVLDRPNPLGGERVEGPFAAPREEVGASMVNRAPGPLVHGLTLGEMARYVNARLARPARLTVVPLSGWRRAMTWRETGRTWVAPSPNLRSPEAAIAYPGVALLEATNVSEGRGSETPFLLFGAPWLDPAAMAAMAAMAIDVPGFALAPTSFTPRSSPAAPAPKHQDQEIPALLVEVTQPRAAEPYTLGVRLLRALAARPEFEWLRDGKALSWLVGTPRLLQALRRGDTVDEILATDAADLARWREERQGALLYP